MPFILCLDQNKHSLSLKTLSFVVASKIINMVLKITIKTFILSLHSYFVAPNNRRNRSLFLHLNTRVGLVADDG